MLKLWLDLQHAGIATRFWLMSPMGELACALQNTGPLT